MLKVKCLRTADCVVGGFRYAANSNLAGSLLLGLYNARGLLDHVGFTIIAAAERAGITRKLKALTSGLRPELVVEVRDDQVAGGRFRHGTKLLRWRPDKAPRQCTFERIEPSAPVDLFG